MAKDRRFTIIARDLPDDVDLGKLATAMHHALTRDDALAELLGFDGEVTAVYDADEGPGAFYEDELPDARWTIQEKLTRAHNAQLEVEVKLKDGQVYRDLIPGLEWRYTPEAGNWLRWVDLSDVSIAFEAIASVEIIKKPVDPVAVMREIMADTVEGKLRTAFNDSLFVRIKRRDGRPDITSKIRFFVQPIEEGVRAPCGVQLTTGETIRGDDIEDVILGNPRGVAG